MVTSALFVFAFAAVPAATSEQLDDLQELTRGLMAAGAAALNERSAIALVHGDEDKYAGASADSEEMARAAFAPMCADKLEALSAKWTPAGTNRARAATPLTLGHSLGTHFQVQCEHGLPMDEAECDELASQLQVTVASGAPFRSPPNATNATNATATEAEATEEAAALVRRHSDTRILPDAEEKEALAGQIKSESQDPEVEVLASVEEWCEVLFDSFFAEILAANEEAAGGEEEAAALVGHSLVSRANRAKVRKVQNADAWQPMRNLLEKEAAILVKLARRNATGNASAPLYGKALHEANEAATAAKAKVLAGAADADAAKTKEAFVPECVATLTTVSEKYLSNGLRGASMTLGLSMATHLQVQCHDGMPIPEEKCDGFASELLKLLDAGHPLIAPTPPPPAANGTNGTNGTNATEAPAAEEAALAVAGRFRSERLRKALAHAAVLRNDTNATEPAGPMAHGEEWCGAFFDEFLAGVIADVAAAAEEGAEEAPAEEAAAFLKKK